MQAMHLDRDSALTAAEPVPSPAATLLELDARAAVAGRTLTRDSVLFGAGSLAGKAIGFIVLTRLRTLLAPGEFGEARCPQHTCELGPAYRRCSEPTWRRCGCTSTSRTTTNSGACSRHGYRSRSPPRRSQHRSSSQVRPVSRLLFGSAISRWQLHVRRCCIAWRDRPFRDPWRPPCDGTTLTYALLEGGAFIINAGLAVLLLVTWRADASAVMLALASAGRQLPHSDSSLFDDRSSPAHRARRTHVAAPGASAGTGDRSHLGSRLLPSSLLLGAAGADPGRVPVRGDEDRVRCDARRGGRTTGLASACLPTGRLGRSHDTTGRGRPSDPRGARRLCRGDRRPDARTARSHRRRLLRSRFPAVGLFLVSVLGVGLFTIGSLPSVIERRTP